MIERTLRGIVLVFVWMLFLFPLGCSRGSPVNEGCAVVNENVVEFRGAMYPKRYNSRADRAEGHHFIVWAGGGNSKKALIESNCSDRVILKKLKEAGARPGNNLSIETWTERHDPESPEPDRRVKGTPVIIEVAWDDTVHPAYQLFQNGKPDHFDFRVGGHKEYIELWESGCVTCLFSCPGGRTGNAMYTIRDQVKEKHAFRVRTNFLPPEGTVVTVRMTVKASKTSEQR